MQGEGGVFHIGADMGNSTDMANFEIHGDLTLYISEENFIYSYLILIFVKIICF